MTLNKIFNAICPCCNETLSICIENDNVVSIKQFDLELSETELVETLKQLNIEFG